jgi:PIN domain nuclease of toxin-antitoxin system
VSETVLDASAILAAILGEPGGERVGQLTGSLLLSTVNYAEVGARLADLGHPSSLLGDAVSMLGLQVMPFDAEQARSSVDLRAETRGLGLSLGDRACLALAVTRRAVALTADRAWGEVELPIQVEVVR